jgi:hypothetical protein
MLFSLLQASLTVLTQTMAAEAAAAAAAAAPATT